MVRQLIASVMVDSRKHAGLYNTAAAIMEGKTLSIMDLEFEELEKAHRRTRTLDPVYCPKCGRKNPGDAQYCTVCGKEIPR